MKCTFQPTFAGQLRHALAPYAMLACGLASLLSPVGELSADDSTRRPNIVLIVSDDQGYHDLGCFGNDAIRTPNLDRLAAGGVRLTDFYVTWPACTPSRGSILTGRYPQRNGLYDMIRNDRADDGYLYPPQEYAISPERVLGMDDREITIAQALKKADYTCAAYGKWDGGQLQRFLPLQRGFDDYYGFTNTGIDYFTHERYGVASMHDGNRITEADKGAYATDLFRDRALRFIERNKDKPFFLYVPFNAPHGGSNLDPTIRGLAQAPDAYKKLYPHLKEGLRAGTRYGKPALVPTRDAYKLNYLACVTAMDDAIGQILGALEKHGLTDRTLVIFFSDNGGSGDADNAPLRGRKGSMWEGGVRVPAIVRWPGRVPAGKVSHALLTSLEVLPTAVAAAGLTPRIALPGVVLDGFDMLPVLRGEYPSPRTAMFWQRRDHRAARIGQWKWVDTPGASGLFDLSADIGEQHDLSGAKPGVLAMIKDQWNAWRQAMDGAEPRGPFRDY